MTTRGWFVLLLLAGIAIRAGLAPMYEPIHHQDTDTYMPLAVSMARADFSDFDGRRPPGYPALIALAGLSPRRVWLLQMGAGVVITLLLFHVTLRLTRRPGLAALVGMTYNLNLAQVFFEANLLSETMATLVVVAVCALQGLLYDRIHAGRSVAVPLVAVGSLAGLAALTRPQFIYLPLLVAALIGYASMYLAGTPLRLALARALAAAAPGLVLILGWSYVNYVRLDFFTPSTLVGINLMNHTLPFVESAPERYAPIPQISAKYRDAKIARTGRHNFANWEAIPELKAATGLPIHALSKRLEQMSIELILRHPFRYAFGVAQAWGDFWLAPNYWTLDRLKSRSLATVLRSAWWMEHWLVRLFNAMFLVLVGLSIVSRRFRRAVRWETELTGLCAVVLLASLVQAMGEWGENPRYAIPVQALIVLVVLVVGWRWTSRVTGRDAAETPAERGRSPRTDGGKGMATAATLMVWLAALLLGFGPMAVRAGERTLAPEARNTVGVTGEAPLPPPPARATLDRSGGTAKDPVARGVGGNEWVSSSNSPRGQLARALPVSGGVWQRLKTGGLGDPQPNSGGFQPWAYNDRDGSLWYYNSSEAGAIYRFDFGTMRWTRMVTSGIGRARHNCATVYDRDNQQLYIGGCAPDAGQPEAHRVPTTGPRQGQMISLTPNRFPIGGIPACGYDSAAKVIQCFGGWGYSTSVHEHSVVPFFGLGNWITRTPTGPLPAIVAGQPGATDYTRSTFNRGGWSLRHGKLYVVDAVGDLWFYDRPTNAWSRVATNGHKPPPYVVVALHDAANVVVGWAGCGFDCSHQTAQTYLLDVTSGVWSLGPAGSAGPSQGTFQAYNILYHEARQTVVLMMYGIPPELWEFRLPQSPPPHRSTSSLFTVSSTGAGPGTLGGAGMYFAAKSITTTGTPEANSPFDGQRQLRLLHTLGWPSNIEIHRQQDAGDPAPRVR